MSAEVTDLRDTRVLIPRLRRALQGPHASGSAVPGNSLSDDEVNAIAADAIGDLILYSGSETVFGHRLEVVERDPYYMAPVAWRTDGELTDAEIAVIVAQAALTYYGIFLNTLKTAETIQDEGQTWTYEIGASVLTERIKGLRSDRDRALEILAGKHLVSDTYVNYLAVRDSWTDALIEPFTRHPGGGFGAGGGLETDPRFGGPFV